MYLEESMDILLALKQEETRLQKQLKGILGAITALNGSHTTSTGALVAQGGRRRTMSAAARARISKATKARWAKFRAEKNKRGK
jgi:hypothetical protein